MIKLLALDLDGTLLDSRSEIPAGHVRAVRRAQQAGVQVALCTGRSLNDAAAFSGALEAPADWLISCNGADVRRPGQPPVSTGYMERALFERLLDAGAARGAEPCMYTPERVYYSRAFERFVDSIRVQGCRLDYENRPDYVPAYTREAWDAALDREGGAVCKAILYHDDPAVVDAVLDRLRAEGGYELAPSAMFGGKIKNVEVNRAGVNKGTALLALAAKLGVPRDGVMAIGDSDNDLAMLEAAGLSVAMGNAPDYVCAAAQYRTATSDENGVGLAVERFILNGEDGI